MPFSDLILIGLVALFVTGATVWVVWYGNAIILWPFLGLLSHKTAASGASSRHQPLSL
jgi:hypothetical protein